MWKGVKTSNILRQSAVTAAEKLNKRYRINIDML